jgi:hypothetical protein
LPIREGQVREVIPVESPAMGIAPVICAHAGKLERTVFVTVKVPSPFENATGTLPHPASPCESEIGAAVAVEASSR